MKTLLIILTACFLCINIFAQPSNDNCSNAIALTSATSCNNIQYNLRNATASAGVPVGCASGGTHFDSWFQFTAVSSTHTITISNLQSNFNNPEIQLFSGTCGSLTSIVCGVTTMSTSTLIIGNTYYIRVSNIGSSPSSQGRFDICVTHPPAVPGNDNCSAATTLTPNSACSPTTSNLYYSTNSAPTGTCGGATSTTTFDVWFSFQATSATHTITVNGLGSRLSAASTYLETFSGACGSLTSLSCVNVSGRTTLSGLTIGAFYYARVYITTNPTAGINADWNFNICVQQPPANNECTGAITLTSGASCSNTAGTLDLATANGTVPIGCFAAGTYYDVWYSFVASATTHIITLSSTGANFTAPRIQIYGGTCGVLTSLGCTSGVAHTQAGLTIGATYYIRIANFNANPSGTGTVANFNICVTAAPSPPANDLCTGAISIVSGTSCSNISGTLLRATATAGLPACGNNSSADVWYSFVAQSAYPTITLSSIGANLTTASPRIQLFSGNCGSLASLACTTTPLSVRTAIGGAGLTIGVTYYVRITTNTNTGTPTSGTWTFNICITDPAQGAVIDYAKSYINVTDGTVGGAIDPGDVLEIRATLVVNRNGATHHAIDSVAYFDTLFASTGFALVPGSISLRTNEGKVYNSFTDPFDTDAGYYTSGGAGTDTMIRINMGAGSNNVSRGKLRSSSRPSFYNNTCIIMATFRVTVNKPYGSIINYGGGAFTYRDSVTGILNKIYFPKDSLVVFQSIGTCQDASSPTNILGDEFNGTFGTPAGSPVYPQNRGTSPNTNYTYATFGANAPQDYYYGVANNTSAAGTTVQTVAKPNAARVFTHWDITGDHTNATNPAKGNSPCNLSQPVSSTNPCGYMLVVNAAYRTDIAFTFNVSGACPNTYYEISTWLKNICYRCGCDSVGRGSGSAGYIPTDPGDSSGVRPNIAIEINGKDYYTTGNLLYQGLGGTQSGSDTLNNWVRKSFVYKTGMSETNFSITFRNNAPGGGGNDWAIDDIDLRTCMPNINVSPGPNPFVCDSNVVDFMTATVSSYYDSYVYYQWEMSSDGGSTWSASSPATGPVSPAWSGSSWDYTVTHPSFVAYPTDSGKLFRVVVATTPSNLSSSTCRFNDGNIMALTVDPCNYVLESDILTLGGKNINGEAILTLVTSKETNNVRYEVERSFDGRTFAKIADIPGYNDPTKDTNIYRYKDPFPLKDITLYRIKRKNVLNKIKYSNVVRLVNIRTGITIQSLVNPFMADVTFEVISGFDGIMKTEILDQSGRKIRNDEFSIRKGVTDIVIENLGMISSGAYILRIIAAGVIIHRKIVKQKN